MSKFAPVILAYFSLLIISVLDNLRSPYFPEIIADLKLNPVKASAFFAMVSFVSFFGSSASHRVMQKHSALFLLGIGSVGMALGYSWIALSREFWILMLACAFFGCAFGAMNLAHNMLVVESSPTHLRRRLLNGLHSMYGVSSVLAPLVASFYFWLEWKWRSAFLVTAALPLVTLLAIGFLRAERPTKSERVEPLSPSEWKICLLFSIMLTLYLCGEISAATRMVQWLRTERGFAPNLANLYLSGFFAFMLAGRLLFGFVSFKRVSNWQVLCGSAGAACLCYILALAHSPFWMMVSGLAMAPFYPTAMDQLSQIFHRKTGRALGFIIGFGSFSMAAMQLIVGFFTADFGLTKALLIGPVGLALAFVALCAVLVVERRTAELKSR